jgi:outer membrane protein assembly factor BamB
MLLLPVSQLLSQPDSSRPTDAWLEFGGSGEWQSHLQLDPEKTRLFRIWEVTIGEGRSQPVGVAGEIYVTAGSSRERDDGVTEVTTNVFGLKADSGETLWTFESSGQLREQQQTFGGAKASPQSTPAIVGKRLIVVTFTGQLLCLDRMDGKLLWQKDLVIEFGARPVPFGFAASPRIDPAAPDRVVVLACGEGGGLLALDATDGSVAWKSPCSTPAYATPVSGNLGGVEQWLITSELEVAGIEQATGIRLWQYNLPLKDMTNVPTPLVVDSGRVVISGQGCNGTRCLSVTRSDSGWKVEESWHSPRLEFFYANWLRIDDRIVLGCNDRGLTAFDLRDGSTLGKWRDFEDGNLIRTGDGLLIMDKHGEAALLQIRRIENGIDGLTIAARFPVLDSRVWTAPSTIGDQILFRSADQLVCLSLENPGGLAAVEIDRVFPKTLEFETSRDPAPGNAGKR